MDFSQVESFTIPEGEVKKIESGGVTLWEKQIYAVEAVVELFSGDTIDIYYSQTVDRGVEVDWGDGTKATYSGSYDGEVYTVSTDHDYLEDGQYTIRFKVLDGKMNIGKPGGGRAFMGGKKLSVSINDGVEKIHDGALRGYGFDEDYSLTIDSNDLIYIGSPGSNNAQSIYIVPSKIRLPKSLSDYEAATGNQVISSYFLKNCISFTGELIVECNTNAFIINDNLLSTTNPSVSEYTIGIRISGPYASALKALLPDRDTSPYRKLILDTQGE